MKTQVKFLGVIVIALFTACATGGGQGGQEYTRGRDFVVTQNSDGTVGIRGYRGRATDVRIPPQIRGRSVTWIAPRAFYRQRLTSVTLPESVTTIGQEAFAWNHLTRVTIPNSVTHIGWEAFARNGLVSVIIPDSVTAIGGGAFRNNLLTSVTIGNGVIDIGEGAFEDNQLTSVVIPDSVITIGQSAFSNNQLTSVTIGNSVTTIQSGAFAHNQLTEVSIPDSVTFISSASFGVVGAFSENPLRSTPITAQQRQRSEQLQAQQEARNAPLAALFQQAGNNFGNLPRSGWVGTFQTDTFLRYDFGDGVFVRDGPGFFAGMRGEFRVSGNTLVLRYANGNYSSRTFVGNTFTEIVQGFHVVFRRIN